MAHLAYARKYRPSTFDEIIDQEHIATTLKNAISRNNIAHAYLFSGPRGIGKTSTARILAKALNCKKGPTPQPCNKCDSCVEIRDGRSMDVLEIDGASNRGIDEIRTLRENVKFAPSSSRFKIYIIDEVHMLTTEAFNALLKTLEEPPAHVTFIFATTEPHKVLATILSRCQRFDFHKISTAGIVAKLKTMAKEEKISVAEDALFAIARSSEGSLRDAEVVLDQMNSFTQGTITLEGVNDLLGLVSQDAVMRIISQLEVEHQANNLKLVDDLIREGKDAVQIINSLLEQFRFMMLTNAGADTLIDVTPEDRARIAEQSRSHSLPRILYSLTVLSQAAERCKRQGLGRLFLEMALLKLSQPVSDIPSDELLDALIRIEQKLGPSDLRHSAAMSPPTMRPPAKAAASRQTAASPPAKDTAAAVLATPPPMKNNAGSDPEPTAQAGHVGVLEASAEGDVQLGQVHKVWPQLIKTIRKQKIFLGECLAVSRPVGMRGNVLQIGFSRQNDFQREHALETAHIKTVEETIQALLGRAMKVSVLACDDISDTPVCDLPEPESAESDSPLPEQESSPPEEGLQNFIQSTMDVFDGQILHSDE